MLGTCKAIGEIDLSTAPALNAVMHEAIDNSESTSVVVDCSNVSFMDSAGFHVLVDATEYAARRGRTLVVHNLSPSCARLIGLCDWDNELHVEP